MTNHPEAALRALADSWRERANQPIYDSIAHLAYGYCADELAAILRQIQDAPSLVVGPADSSQGEPYGYVWEYSDGGCSDIRKWPPSQAADNRRNANFGHKIIPLYTTPPPSSPQVAVADGLTREQMVQQIMQDACEQEPAPWDGEGTICIDVDALQMIVEAALLAPAAPQSAPAEPQGVDWERGRYPGKITQHWLRVAFGRIAAGEPEREVLFDYGYVQEKMAEPQARHWREAMEKYKLETIDDIERIARSLAQAEQAAKGEE